MRSLLPCVAHPTDKSPRSRRWWLPQPISPPPTPPNAAEPPLPVVKTPLVNGMGELEGAFEEVTLIFTFHMKHMGKNDVGKWLGCARNGEVLWDAANPERSKMMLLTPRAQNR